MSLKNYLTILMGAFLGGAGGWASTHLAQGLPSTSSQIGAFGLSAAIAGLVAIGHLYQTPDGKVMLPINSVPLPVLSEINKEPKSWPPRVP